MNRRGMHLLDVYSFFFHKQFIDAYCAIYDRIACQSEIHQSIATLKLCSAFASDR